MRHVVLCTSRIGVECCTQAEVVDVCEDWSRVLHSERHSVRVAFDSSTHTHLHTHQQLQPRSKIKKKIAHTRKSHVTHTNESCQTRTNESHSSRKHTQETRTSLQTTNKKEHRTHDKESCHTHE